MVILRPCHTGISKGYAFASGDSYRGATKRGTGK
jgi:hypothetical protein